ncbi:MAG: alanine--glyoxylate aminotransferase family protein [Acidobacteriota bacterium]
MEPVEPIRFFLPGPTYVPQAARQAMTQPVVAHRSPSFQETYATVAEGLQRVFRTAGEVVVATGSSTLMMESAIVSTVERKVLHLTGGAFSERWLEISRCLGKAADQVAVPWGQGIDPELVRQALRRGSYDVVTVVHNETSTGVMNPLEEIARVVREESDALLLVDAVSSLGGAPVEVDGWGLDVVVTGSQKALAVPPGLALVSLSARALERCRALPHRGFYTDLLRYADKHRGGGTITTPAVSVVYALEHQLARIGAEGLEERWRRHRQLARQVATWARRAGLTLAAADGVRSATVTCLEAPAGWTPRQLLGRLAEDGWTVAGGYGQWKPKTFRIGHMGEVRATDLEPLLAALDQLLADPVWSA